MGVLTGLETLFEDFRIGACMLRKYPGSRFFGRTKRTGKSNTRATAPWLLWGFFLFEEAAEAVNGIGWSFAGVFSDARTETGGTA